MKLYIKRPRKVVKNSQHKIIIVIPDCQSRTPWAGVSTSTPGFKKLMNVVANSGSINFKKTGSIRTVGVLSKKILIDNFLVPLPFYAIRRLSKF